MSGSGGGKPGGKPRRRLFWDDDTKTEVWRTGEACTDMEQIKDPVGAWPVETIQALCRLVVQLSERVEDLELRVKGRSGE